MNWVSHSTNSDQKLDLAEIAKAASLQKETRFPVGMAVSPKTYHSLKSLCGETQIGGMRHFLFLPELLVDQRMGDEKTTVYFDQDLWLERVKEQNEWDTK